MKKTTYMCDKCEKEFDNMLFWGSANVMVSDEENTDPVERKYELCPQCTKKIQQIIEA